MEYRESRKDKFFSHNTLVGLVQAIQGKQTTVDLRNGHSVTGKIEHCDSHINVDMSDALFRDGSGKPHVFDNFFIHSRNIRYVHIPQQVDMIKALENYYKDKNAMNIREPQKQTFKRARALKTHAETEKLISMSKGTVKKQNP